MQKLITIGLLSLGFILIACKNLKGIEFPSDKTNYVGTWICQDPEIVLSIKKNGSVKYSFKDGSLSKSIEAPIQQFDSNDFVVGALGITTKFKVSKTPYQENGKWKIVVDERILTKVDKVNDDF
ncbi:hypothetical protein ETU08_05485 [Apibacter muscae]|uniref:hypothetical protein n=1 Tax=Apibacter muscae TaxID=2509004 RepID=UPI0011AD96C8|nr:hypothetical protein [Apibacter muscae]TWP30012.1 hypothetical protein ETU08_05485 [Apibacter muscae]